MAMLKKTLVAAVACGAIAFAASAYAQTGAAGPAGSVGAATPGMAGGVGTPTGPALGNTGTNTGGLAGTNGMNSTANNGLPGTSSNTLANNSPGRNGIGTTSNNVATNNTMGANGIGSGTAPGANGIGSNNMTTTMGGTRLAQNQTANSPGTSGPAGTTAGAAPVAGAGALPAGGTALGGNGIRHRVVATHQITHHVVRRVANVYPGRHITHLRMATHFVQGRTYGLTAMAMENARERRITSKLNRAQLRGPIG